jgi:hypothetical protein
MESEIPVVTKSRVKGFGLLIQGCEDAALGVKII